MRGLGRTSWGLRGFRKEDIEEGGGGGEGTEEMRELMGEEGEGKEELESYKPKGLA